MGGRGVVVEWCARHQAGAGSCMGKLPNAPAMSISVGRRRLPARQTQRLCEPAVGHIVILQHCITHLGCQSPVLLPWCCSGAAGRRPPQRRPEGAQQLPAAASWLVLLPSQRVEGVCGTPATKCAAMSCENPEFSTSQVGAAPSQGLSAAAKFSGCGTVSVLWSIFSKVVVDNEAAVVRAGGVNGPAGSFSRRKPSHAHMLALQAVVWQLPKSAASSPALPSSTGITPRPGH